MTTGGWNRLTNGQRAELTKLPVWTTEDDRRRALSYVGRDLSREARDALAAVREGRRAPAGLGEIVAVARYEDAGWMPDGCFDRWRRWDIRGAERMSASDLVPWLGVVEQTMRCRLTDLEAKLTAQRRAQDEQLATAQAAADRAYQKLREHHQWLIQVCLSIGDVDGAREIALRMENEPAPAPGI